MQQEVTQRDMMFRRFQIHKFRSEGMVPTVTMTININAARMIELKNRANINNDYNSHITITHIVTKAIAVTLKKYQVLYCFFDGKEIIENTELAINIPVDIENHVEYIVIHKPELKTLMDISIECRSELNKIRSGNGEFMKIIKQMSALSNTSPNDPIVFLRKHYGNFVLSNFGSLNIDMGSLALSQPMISGICIGSVKSVMLRESNNWIDTRYFPITISFDHRPIDGAYVGRFLNEVKKLLENPDIIFSSIE